MTKKGQEKINFDDLDDFGEGADIGSTAPPETAEEFIAQAPSQSHYRFEEKCKACRGSGQWISFSGRSGGDCFKCHGKGVRHFRSSPETRQRAREQKVVRGEQKEHANVEQFAAANPVLADWLDEASGRGFDFATSLRGSIRKYGHLSEKQFAAAEKCRAKDDARNSERKAERKANESDIDLTDVPAGYYAVPEGESRLKVRIKHPKGDSKYAGWIFVDDGGAYGSRQNYGSQRPGETYGGKIQEQLRAIIADPEAAGLAYGKLTGSCGVCGRPLEDEKSVAAGIGPVCAAKTGWGG